MQWKKEKMFGFCNFTLPRSLSNRRNDLFDGVVINYNDEKKTSANIWEDMLIKNVTCFFRMASKNFVYENAIAKPVKTSILIVPNFVKWVIRKI